MEKIRPQATIYKNYGVDGKDEFYEILYLCPVCGKRIRGYAVENACNKCGTFFDWGKRPPRIEVSRRVLWR